MKTFLKVLVAVIVACSAMAIANVDSASASAATCGSGYKYVSKGSKSNLEIRLYSNKKKKIWCAITYRKGDYKKYAGSTYAILCKANTDKCYRTEAYTKTRTPPTYSRYACVSDLGAAYYRGSSGKKTAVATKKNEWCRKDMK